MDEPDKIEQVVARACSARESLTSAGLRCYRLLDGYREGLEGVVVDRYGDGAVIRYRPDREGFLPQLASALVLHTDCTLVTARVRNAGEPPTVLLGTLPSTPVIAFENELRFLIDFARAGNPAFIWMLVPSEPGCSTIRQTDESSICSRSLAASGSQRPKVALARSPMLIAMDRHLSGPGKTASSTGWPSTIETSLVSTSINTCGKIEPNGSDTTGSFWILHRDRSIRIPATELADSAAWLHWRQLLRRCSNQAAG